MREIVFNNLTRQEVADIIYNKDETRVIYLADLKFTQGFEDRNDLSFHVIFKNTLDDKKSFESDTNNSFDFPAAQSLAQAETNLMNDMTRNIVDAIFNKIFSNW